jgi:hypothetical protein
VISINPDLTPEELAWLDTNPNWDEQMNVLCGVYFDIGLMMAAEARRRVFQRALNEASEP